MRDLPKFELARRTVVLFSLSVGLLLVWIALSSSSAVTLMRNDTPLSGGEPTWDLPALDVPPVSCVGPRGLRLNESIDDQLQPSFHDPYIYPEPISGSFEALGLNKSWNTVDERYGPYGFRQTVEDYKYSQVDWDKVRWGSLQDQCAQEDSPRLPNHFNLTSIRRFQYRQDYSSARFSGNPAKISSVRDAREKYGKQAIVLRTWSTYPYTEDDKQNLRSIVAEAALASHGKYIVFLLVDVKDLDGYIHSDDTGYASVLEKFVPQEFRDMAVLFDTTMLESWYPAVLEHSPFWQMMQPLQLFSQLYPEFDHYWQLEMDVRITQHVGQILDAFDKFGEEQPRKQSHERASWSYMPQFYGTYADFTQKVNLAMPNGTGTWGPTHIGEEISPIGPKPPSPKPYDTEANWKWGVGEPADLLLFNTLMDVRRLEDWPFRHWHYGFTKDKDLPFWHSPSAQGRASWNLLNAIHHAQSQQDLRIPSETTLPSFALWHGLKLVSLPLPNSQDPERNRDELNFVLQWWRHRTIPGRFCEWTCEYKRSVNRLLCARKEFRLGESDTGSNHGILER